MTTSKRPAGRPMDAGIDSSIISATQILLSEQGFDRFSVEGIAARAGVGKAAIYRRWSGKIPLVIAAIVDLAQVPPVPDAGSLREDLLECGMAYVQATHTQQIMAGLMTAMTHHPELRDAAREAIGEPFQALFETVIDRALNRGDASTGTDTLAAASVFPALAFHRATVLGLTIDEAFVTRTVDAILMPLLTGSARQVPWK